ncbi:MAG: hypothetical protein ACRDGK_08925 [Actinomycetota bacterium]
MMEPVTVWRVQLRRGDISDREGTLSLEADALVFEDRDTGGRIRLTFAEIRSAKRVRGSPILLVGHDDGADRAETAFYFSRPPPLATPEPGSGGTTAAGRPLGPFAAMRRTSKRRHQRENVKYLTTKSSGAKVIIQAWADELTGRSGG